jgi:hypothetical protein
VKRRLPAFAKESWRDGWRCGRARQARTRVAGAL